MLKKIAVAGLLCAASSAALAAKIGFNVSHASNTAEVRGSGTNSLDYNATEYGFSMVTNYDQRTFNYRLSVDFMDGEIEGGGSLDGFTVSNVFAFSATPPKLAKGAKQGPRFWFGPGVYAGNLEGTDTDTDLGYLGFGLAAGIDFPTESGAFAIEGAYRKLNAVIDFNNNNNFGFGENYDIDGFQFRARFLFGK